MRRTGRSREKLHEAESRGLEIIDRMLPADEIGHCKIVIYVTQAARRCSSLVEAPTGLRPGCAARQMAPLKWTSRKIAEQGLEYS